MVAVANIVINARNLTGAAFSGVQNNLTGLQRSAQSATGKLGGLRAAFGSLAADAGDAGQRSAKSVEILNLGMVKLAASVHLVTAAYNKLSNAAQQALAEQQQQITTAIGLAGQFNITIAKGEEISRNIAVSTAKLGKDLPVSSDDINKINTAISGQIATVVKKQGGTADQYEKLLLALSPKIAIAGAGRPADETSAAITGYLSGSVGKEGIDNYKFFSQNSAILEEMKDILAREYKGKDFGQLETVQRLKIFSTAIEKFQTPAAVARLQNTPQAQISALQDSLFNSYVGLFGIQRDLDPKTKEVESVYSSFEKTITKFLGDRGLLAQISRTLGLADVDPLVGVRQAIETFNGYIDGVTSALAGLKTLSPQQIGAGIGKFSAQAVNIVLDGTLQALTMIDYGAVLTAVGSGVLTFLGNLDWKVYAVGSLVVLGAFIAPVVGAVAVAIGGIILGAISAALGGLPILVIAAIGLGIAAIIKLIVDNWKNIQAYGTRLESSIENWYAGVQTAVGNVIESAKDAVVVTIQFLFGRDAPAQIVATSKAIVGGVKYTLGVAGGVIMDSVRVVAALTKNLFNSIGAAFNSIFRVVGDATNAVINAIKGIISAIITPIQNAVSSVASAIPGYVQSTINSGGLATNIAKSVAVSPNVGLASGLAGGAILPKYMGNIPTAANGFFNALMTEASNSPRGSGLVVANSSEYILTRQQMSNLVNGLSTSGKTVNVNFGSGAIALNLPSGTPQEIALQAIAIIEQTLANELENRL